MARRHLSAITPTADGPLQAKLDEHDSALDAIEALLGRDFEGMVRLKAATNMGLSEAAVVGRFVSLGTLGAAAAGTTGAVAATWTADRIERMATNGTAAAFSNLGVLSVSNSAAAAGVQRPHAILPGATKWWIGGQFQLLTGAPFAATAMAGLVLADNLPAALTLATASMVLGVHGPTSTTKFSLWGAAGTAMDTGINIDTNMHRFDAWSDGASTYAQVDSGAIVSGNARPSAKCALPSLHIFDSAVHTAISLDTGWYAGYIDGGLS